MPFGDQARIIADALETQDQVFGRQRAEASMDNESSWYTRLVSGLTLLAGDDEIQYVSGSATITGDAPNARAVVYTARSVITATVDLHGGDPRLYEPRILARNRHSLQGIRVHEVANVFNLTSPDEWPGPSRIELDYGIDETVVLPIGFVTTAAARAFAQLLPGLQADLAAP